MGSNTMRRLRVGIGRPESRNQVTRYVLGRFTRTEQCQLETTTLENACIKLLQLEPIEDELSIK